MSVSRRWSGTASIARLIGVVCSTSHRTGRCRDCRRPGRCPRGSVLGSAHGQLEIDQIRIAVQQEALFQRLDVQASAVSARHFKEDAIRQNMRVGPQMRPTKRVEPRRKPASAPWPNRLSQYGCAVTRECRRSSAYHAVSGRLEACSTSNRTPLKLSLLAHRPQRAERRSARRLEHAWSSRKPLRCCSILQRNGPAPQRADLAGMRRTLRQSTMSISNPRLCTSPSHVTVARLGVVLAGSSSIS